MPTRRQGLQSLAYALFVALTVTSCGKGTVTVDVETPDTQAPTVTIQSPDPSSTVLTAESTLSLSGTATDDDGVARVEWSSDQGSSGTATGTSQWSITDLTLAEGTQVITVTAYDPAGNPGAAVVTVYRDQTYPELGIEGPTTGSAYNTVDATVTISGSASDDNELASLTWSADTGGSGTIEPGASWEIADLSLSLGATVITVTAEDAVGNNTEASITVTRFANIGSVVFTPGVVLTNRSENIRFTFSAEAGTTLAGPAIVLSFVDESNVVGEELGSLRDDGDLNNGDEILGDGVYSGIFTLNESSEGELRLQVTTTILVDGAETEGRSALGLLPVHHPTSAMEDQRQSEVQSSAAETLEALLDVETLSGAVDQTAEYIRGLAGVAEVSVEGVTSISIEYESGLRGGLFFNQTGSTGDEITRSGGAPAARALAPQWVPTGPDTIVRSKTVRIPPHLQTVGSLGTDWAGPLAVAPMLTAGTSDVILNRKVLIYARYEAVWAPYNEGPALVSLFDASPLGLDVTYLQNQDATVEALQSLTSYGLDPGDPRLARYRVRHWRDRVGE